MTVLLGEGLVEYLSHFIDSAPRKEIEQMNLGMLLAFQAEIGMGEWEGGYLNWTQFSSTS